MKAAKVGGIAAIVIVGIIVVYFLFASVPRIAQNAITEVNVSGNVQTTGIGTKPVFVDFTDTNSGQSSSANANGGSYSIVLQNNHSYNIVVHYSAGLGVTSGTCNAGVLSLYSTSSSLQRDISC